MLLKSIPRVCQHCGKHFMAAAVYVNKGNARFCCWPCAAAARNRRTIRNCQGCGHPFVATAWEVSNGAAKFCSRACHYANPTRATPEEAFWAKVRKTDGCWLWTGNTTGGGYGDLGKRRAASRHAHRFSWELHCGPIPKGLFVLHKCDVRACVRPDHLFLGTFDDNMADMFAKGRYSHGDRHPSSILTAERVRAMRARYAAGGVSYSQIAAENGVHIMTAYNAITRKTWKHVK